MTEAEPIVFVVDDDASVRTLDRAPASLGRIRGADVRVRAGVPRPARARTRPACLVLDVRLPGLSGLDLQRELAAAGRRHPDHLHHRSRRHPDDGARDEGGRGRVPDQAVPQAGPARRDPRGDRARSRAHATSGARPARCASATSSSPRASARSWRSSSPGLLNKQIAAELATAERTDQVPPRAHHAEDGGRVARGAGPHGGAARRRAGLSRTCPKGQLEPASARMVTLGHEREPGEEPRWRSSADP